MGRSRNELNKAMFWETKPAKETEKLWKIVPMKLANGPNFITVGQNTEGGLDGQIGLPLG